MIQEIANVCQAVCKICFLSAALSLKADETYCEGQIHVWVKSIAQNPAYWCQVQGNGDSQWLMACVMRKKDSLEFEFFAKLQ